MAIPAAFFRRYALAKVLTLTVSDFASWGLQHRPYRYPISSLLEFTASRVAHVGLTPNLLSGRASPETG